MKSILLTNDDGFQSDGIIALKDRLKKKFQVTIVAPEHEKSAISMALTLHSPLRVQQNENGVYAVEGTTCDCINLALKKILHRPPDFIISGMNQGENLSEDIFFSGTVGGAFSGLLYDVPSLAVSLIPRENSQDFNIEEGAVITERILDKLFNLHHRGVIYNVNIPYNHNGKIKITTLGHKRYQPEIIERTDPRGKLYYWIGTGSPAYFGDEGTDVWAIKNKYISLSVVKYDVNAKGEAEAVKDMFKNW